MSSDRVDNELELGTDLEDTVLYKDKKLKDQVEVAIGDGMEFTIPGKHNMNAKEYEKDDKLCR